MSAWQFGPLYPGTRVQWYWFTWSMQLPPLWQGLLAHEKNEGAIRSVLKKARRASIEDASDEPKAHCSAEQHSTGWYCCSTLLVVPVINEQCSAIN